MKNLIALALLLICIAAKAKEGMLAGNLNSVGSDTLGNLMALWGDHFSQQYPGVNVQIQRRDRLRPPRRWRPGLRNWAR